MRSIARYRPSASMVVAIVAVVAASVGTAIGAPGKGSSTTLTYVTQSTGQNGDDNKTISVSCPAGEVLVDEGAFVTTDGDAYAGNSSTDDEAAAVTRVDPGPNPSSGPTPTTAATQVTAEAQEFATGAAIPTAQTQDWFLTVEGWCKS